MAPLPAHVLTAGRGLTSSRIITYPVFCFLPKNTSQKHAHFEQEYQQGILSYPVTKGTFVAVFHAQSHNQRQRWINRILIFCILISNILSASMMSFISRTPPFSSYYKRAFFPEVFTIGVLTHTSILSWHKDGRPGAIWPFPCILYHSIYLLRILNRQALCEQRWNLHSSIPAGWIASHNRSGNIQAD